MVSVQTQSITARSSTKKGTRRNLQTRSQLWLLTHFTYIHHTWSQTYMTYMVCLSFARRLIMLSWTYEELMLLTQGGRASSFLKSTYVGCSIPWVCRVNCCRQVMIFFLSLLAGHHLLLSLRSVVILIWRLSLKQQWVKGKRPFPLGSTLTLWPLLRDVIVYFSWMVRLDG